MAKRPSDPPVDGGHQAYLKRQKIHHFASSAEDIQSSQQLQQLLAFDQDAGRAKHGIQSFKAFLETLTDEDEKKRRFPILKDYLNSQKPRDEDDQTAISLTDIIQTWSFASQSNNDSLLSAVPAVLALLLRTLSAILELSEYGLRLGRTLLKKRQLELFARGLTSNKSKDYVISPCLRLLRELVTFDGGALAKEVFRVRDFTLKALARNLGLRYVGDGIEDHKKPSVRTNAIRFFLAILKFLHVEARKELLCQRDVISAVTRDIIRDPPSLVVELLDTMEVHILKDEELAHDAKSRFLNPTNLGRILTLYGYAREDDQMLDGGKSISSRAHEFLVLACTSPGLGILRQQAGFYPRGVDPDEYIDPEGHNFIDLGLESLEWADQFTEKVPVRNTMLSEFIQSLRPWSNTKQSELLLAIFKAAPELVADYFFGKKSFTFEPKLTATWIGYSAFLFSTILLPVPPYFGHQDRYGRVPPPSSVVLESILPLPLTQKALTRCLNQKSSLVTLFAVRLLVIAFQKLQDVLNQYHVASKTGSPIWDQAARQLTEQFCQRCPVMKDVTSTFRNTAENDLIQRHAASKLVVMYYETIPQIALESKFDVSNVLTEALRLLEEANTGAQDAVMRAMEVENLFQIAHCSPGMRWFNKSESLTISPFTAMLRLLAQSASEVPLLKMRGILDSVIKESGIMQFQTDHSAQVALIVALRSSNVKISANAVYEFLDNCALRCATAPVKYIDVLEHYYAAAYGKEVDDADLQRLPVSLLLLAMVEQWPFVVKSADNDKIDDVTKFVSNYIAASMKIGEDEKVIKEVIKDLVAESPEGSSARKVIERPQKLVDLLETPELPAISSKSGNAVETNSFERDESKDVEASMLENAEYDVDDHSALTRWTAKEIEEVIEEGHAAALVMLLSSSHLSARKEALSNIAKLALKLKGSTYEEKEQVWLLLSELIETARPHITQQSLPTTISAFASHALSVLRDPLHCLYPKVNKFLSQGPTWEFDKFPLMHTILNEAPSFDDAYYLEISFLLTYLSSGLRTPEDMAIFHKRRVFEKLLSLYNNAYIAKGIKEKILRILWRATSIEGGSTTLVTRFGILSWLQAQMRLDSWDKGKALKALVERILKTCDEERLKAWSHRGVDDFLAEL